MVEDYSPEYWKNLLPVVTAFSEGKEIQNRRLENGEWKTNRLCNFGSCGGDYTYRVKPDVVWPLDD